MTDTDALYLQTGLMRVAELPSNDAGYVRFVVTFLALYCTAVAFMDLCAVCTRPERLYPKNNRVCCASGNVIRAAPRVCASPLNFRTSLPNTV